VRKERKVVKKKKLNCGKEKRRGERRREERNKFTSLTFHAKCIVMGMKT
jgi:hypothetical protein